MPNPLDESAAIFNHYFAQLARAAGLRWSERNAADIGRACELLGQVVSEPPTGDIPPYQPIVSERQTLVLDRDTDPRFEQWRAQRRAEEEAATERMLARERGAR